MARNKEFDVTERLEKAKNLFWQKGYNATSMQDLTAAMQLNPGSIYGTYGDKRKLFLESLKLYTQQAVEEYRTANFAANSPLQSIKSIINKALNRCFIEKKACMVVNSSFEFGNTDQEIHQVLEKQTKEIINLLEELLKLGKESGSINPQKDAKTMATFIVSSFAGFYHMQVILGDKKMLLAMSEFLIESIQ